MKRGDLPMQGTPAFLPFNYIKRGNLRNIGGVCMQG